MQEVPGRMYLCCVPMHTVVKVCAPLIYCCLPPGQAQEYQTLTFQRCEGDKLTPTIAMPKDRNTDVSYISHQGDQGGSIWRPSRRERPGSPKDHA